VGEIIACKQATAGYWSQSLGVLGLVAEKLLKAAVTATSGIDRSGLPVQDKGSDVISQTSQ